MNNDDARSKVVERRNDILESFVEWILKAGLNPLDYELVEEHRADGVIAWYFQKRIKDEPIEDATGNSHIN